MGFQSGAHICPNCPDHTLSDVGGSSHCRPAHTHRWRSYAYCMKLLLKKRLLDWFQCSESNSECCSFWRYFGSERGSLCRRPPFLPSRPVGQQLEKSFLRANAPSVV